jgi:hypothetical protein
MWTDFHLVLALLFWTRQIQVMPLNKSWDEYNESLIERILMDIGFLKER